MKPKPTVWEIVQAEIGLAYDRAYHMHDDMRTAKAMTALKDRIIELEARERKSEEDFLEQGR